jgi:hypothetical protein
MVPHATTIPTGNVVVNQAPIGTPLSSRPIPSLPPGYHALNLLSPSLPRFHPEFLDFLFHLGTMLLSVLFLHFPGPLRRVLSTFSWGSGPSGSNPIGGTHHHSLLVIRFPLEGNLTLGGNLNLGVKLKLGHNLHLEDNPWLEVITHPMDITYRDH